MQLKVCFAYLEIQSSLGVWEHCVEIRTLLGVKMCWNVLKPSLLDPEQVGLEMLACRFFTEDIADVNRRQAHLRHKEPTKADLCCLESPSSQTGGQSTSCDTRETCCSCGWAKGKHRKILLFFCEVCSQQIIYSSTFSAHVSRCSFCEPGFFECSYIRSWLARLGPGIRLQRKISSG